MSDPSEPDTGDRAGISDQRRVCAVCGRILNSYLSPAGCQSWLHTFADLPEDHPAVPVRLSDGVTAQPRCDFCSDEHPTWEVPARSFVVPGLTSGPVDNASHGNWSACDRCAELIRRNQWTALRRRALAAWSDSAAAAGTGSGPTAGIDQQLAQLYRLLRRNITGPPRRSQPPTNS